MSRQERARADLPRRPGCGCQVADLANNGFDQRSLDHAGRDIEQRGTDSHYH